MRRRYLPKKPLTHRHGGGKHQELAYHEQKPNLSEPDQNFVNEGKPCEISNEQNPALPRTIL